MALKLESTKTVNHIIITHVADLEKHFPGIDLSLPREEFHSLCDYINISLRLVFFKLNQFFFFRKPF